MIRETIDLGIDLGTTNSCAAVCGPHGPEVIRIGGRDYMPSVVYKRGATTYVGDKAYQAITDERRWNDVHYEFKRMMGSQNPYVFSSAGISMTAEELSAEVLKELSGAVEERYSERLRAAVITVPAWFESVQREATLRAGQAAGFEEVVLLPEPVAASLGYGFGQKDTAQQTWLVFDLGGGTLDVALVESVEGELRVINHLGNNYCGGKDLDWLILEKLIFPKLSEQYQIPPFSKKEKFWLLLKPLSEQAKIELSSRNVTNIDTDLNGVEMTSGTPLRTVVELTRNEYEVLISGWIDEAIQYGADLLKESGISSSKIARTLLVGGPTCTPLLRRRIVERLGIPAEIQAIDPLTVVARGAAVFAGSRKLSSKLMTVTAVGNNIPITLHYKPVYADLDPMISGEITSENSVATIEITRSDNAWSSGRLTLINGTFMTRVTLDAGARNIFNVRAYDQQGTLVQICPASFTITHGLDVAPATCPMSYKLSVQDGLARVVADTLIEKGRPLPCSETREYRTTKLVNAGSTDEIIRIPVVEGEYETFDFNRHVGTMLIKGDTISRNLPENSEVHVTLQVNENGIPTVAAFVPFLDWHFETILTNCEMQQVDYQALVSNIAEDKARVTIFADEFEKELETTASRAELKNDALQVQSELVKLQSAFPMGNQATEEDLQKIERQRKALADRINTFASALEMPRAIEKLLDTIDWAREIVETHGTQDDAAFFKDYQQEATKAMQASSLVRIQRVRSDIAGIAWRVLFRIDDFWIGTFQDMCQHAERFSNPQQAQALIDGGRQALARQDIDELKKMVRALWELEPETDRSEASRRFETDIRLA